MLLLPISIIPISIKHIPLISSVAGITGLFETLANYPARLVILPPEELIKIDTIVLIFKIIFVSIGLKSYIFKREDSSYCPHALLFETEKILG